MSDPGDIRLAASVGRDDGIRVSVAITNHNYGQYVGGAIASVLQQTHPPFEIIVVDDGSTDSSRTVLQNLSSDVEVMFTENRGVSAATTTAVQACSGDVVALLDADDLIRSYELSEPRCAP
jgi:glycosyltransferase involved in cell wall biosynthesis